MDIYGQAIHYYEEKDIEVGKPLNCQVSVNHHIELTEEEKAQARQDEPFLFVINYQGDKAFIRQLSDINSEECLFDFEGRGNSSDEMKNNPEKIAKISWQIAPPLYEDYERSFDIVKNNIMAGNSYLTNLTCKVPVSCNLSLEDIFHRAKGKYKLLLRRKRNQTEDKAQQKEEESQNKAAEDTIDSNLRYLGWLGNRCGLRHEGPAR